MTHRSGFSSQEPSCENIPGALTVCEEEEGLSDLRPHGAGRDGRAPQLPGVQELLQRLGEFSLLTRPLLLKAPADMIRDR